MNPVIPFSTSNISLIPRTAFTLKKHSGPTRSNVSRRSGEHSYLSERFILPFPTYVKLFPLYQRDCAWLRTSVVQIVSATGTDVAVEEPDSPVIDEDSTEASEIPTEPSESQEIPTNQDPKPTTAQSKRSRPGRKSEMPPVKDEDLVAGATFTGKVRSIQPFGAFVDFGAFTDGLIHVSRLSDSFVKDVSSVVSVGQEVKVRIVEANRESGRISLTMREGDDGSKSQQRKDSPASAGSDKLLPARRNTSKPNQKREQVKASKFVKGQELEGTVKNLTRAGAFISLPEGKEGFLPLSEEYEDGIGVMMGGSSLQAGQEVSVRVLRIARGQVTLTMKKEEDELLDMEYRGEVVHTATNPFALAFRQNKEIAAFLDEREKLEDAVEKPMQAETSGEKELAEKPVISDEDLVSLGTDEVSKVDQIEDGEISSLETKDDDAVQTLEKDEKNDVGETSSVEATVKDDVASDDKELDKVESMLPESANDAVETLEKDETAAGGETSSIEATVEADIVGDDKEPEKIESTLPQSLGDAVNTLEKDGTADGGETSSMEAIVEADVAVDVKEPEKIESTLSHSIDDAVDTLEKDETVDDGETPSVEAIVEANVGVDNKDPKQIESTLTQSMDDAVEILEKDETANVSETSSFETTVEANASGDDKDLEKVESTLSQIVDDVVQSPEKETEVDSGGLTPEGATTDLGVEVTEAAVSTGEVDLLGKLDSSGKITGEEVSDTKLDGALHTDETLSSPAGDVSSTQEAKDEAEVAESSDRATDSVETQIPVAAAEEPSASGTEDGKVNSPPVNGQTIGNSNGQNGSPSPKEITAKATISPALVKQLREETGAGMMDCKKALSETGGDIVKAQEFLRKKGLASAEKKATRTTAEGRIGSYIHHSRIGVLVEVNCETDFVARGDIFKELVDDLAMQVAACPQVKYLVPEDVPEEIVKKEKEIEMQKEDLLSKPEQIRLKIVEGRIKKRLDELALLEQAYIKNDKIFVKDWVKQTIATIGENIKVKRFVRLNLGEGLEKKSQDFASEVAAQTAAKPVAVPVKEQTAPTEAKDTIQKPPAATISAALVKQLREETGAGMMDCKKALSETGGDLEKAQEYLRKKGLSAAEKKSSRIAAEGRIGCYIHDSRIGVLIEVNSETDFVGRSEKFKEVVDELAMQVVACPQVQFVSIEDIPESIVSKEKELEMQREDLQSKPENIREKIVEGRITKRLAELALLEQPFIKDDKVLVKDLVKQTVAALGENIKVRRFVRFTLGETNEAAGADA